MKTDIPQRQNQADILRLHAAKHRLYNQSGIFWHLSILFAVFSATLLFVVHHIELDFPVEDIFTIITALATTFFTWLIVKWSARKKREGAIVQERIDTILYGLDWNRSLSKPEEVSEEIIESSSNKSKKRPEEFKNWYSVHVAAEDSLEVQALKAQRENLSFDFLLRERFKAWCLGLFLALLFGVVLPPLFVDLSIQKTFVNWLFPVLPLLLFLWKNYDTNRKTVEKDKILEQSVRTTLRRVASGSDTITKQELRDIQDKIFEKRVAPAVIPDWFYKLHLKDLDHLIIKATDNLNRQNAQ